MVYDTLFPSGAHRTLILLLLSWGGGLLAIAGWLLFALHGSPATDMAGAGLTLDPSAGWWGLNIGRSLFFSMESYYHALFFTGIYCLLRQRWWAAVGIALLLSLSHPFTGVEFLAIACLWLLVERVLVRNRTLPLAPIAAMVTIGLLHAWFYLLYLNRFPEHRIVFTQYQLNWRLRFYNMLPAYGIVLFFAVLALGRQRLAKLRWSPQQRLLICWAAAAFLLANHEWLVKSMQPLHFTRGYIWAPLFLLGQPAMQSTITKLARTWTGRLLVAAGSALFLLDNANWIWLNTRYVPAVGGSSVSFINPSQQDILQLLAKHTTTNTLIVGSDRSLPYLATVYAPAYAWISHVYNTPFYEVKQKQYRRYLQNGVLPESWKQRDLMFIANRSDAEEWGRFVAVQSRVQVLYNNGNYALYRYGQRPTPAQ